MPNPFVISILILITTLATTPTIANTNLNTPNKTTTIVGSNLQANANNANNAVNSDNTNNGQININSQNLNISVEILSLFDGKIWYLKALTELKYEVYRNVS